MSILQENIEKLSNGNKNLVCDETKSPRLTCAKFSQFAALHV